MSPERSPASACAARLREEEDIVLSTGKYEALTRIGFGARGVMYLLIGYLALRSGRTEDGLGAMQWLGSGSGRIVVGLMALGFLGYGLWRLTEAAIDSEGHGSDAKGAVVRAAGVASGLIHLGLSFYAARLASGDGSGGGGGTEGGAATALSLPGGQLLLAAVALGLLGAGLYQAIKAYRLEYLKFLDPAAARQAWVKWSGRIGYAARGIVFLVMGLFLARAAFQDDASEAGDMGQALAALPGTLQLLVAAGLALFGLFSFVEARHRRITDPKVLERMQALAA